MRTIPKFYKNYVDNNHCLQAALMMVLNTLIGQVSWSTINKETNYNKNTYTWTPYGASILSKRIKGVVMYSILDYKKFALEGEKYLKKLWKNNGNWYSLQKQKASSGFKKEQKATQNFLKGNSFLNKNLTKEEIEALLKNNYLITLVDAGRTANQNWSSGHFVVVYDQDNQNFLMHDPGLPPRKNVSIPKDLFMNAFMSNTIAIPLN